jgi:hypothetical protein
MKRRIQKLYSQKGQSPGGIVVLKTVALQFGGLQTRSSFKSECVDNGISEA